MIIGVGIGIPFNTKARRILIRDNFDRADSATTLGNAQTGQAWGATGTFGITGNKAYCPANALNFATIATNNSDVDVSATITFNVNEGIVARMTDSANCILVRMDSTSLALFKLVGGVATILGSYAFSPIVGNQYKVKLSVKGSTLKVYLDGVDRLTATDSFNQTATSHGMRLSNNIGKIDDFIVEV